MENRRLKKSNLCLILIRMLILTSSLLPIGQCKDIHLRIRRSEVSININDNKSDPCFDILEEDETTSNTSETVLTELTPASDHTETVLTELTPASNPAETFLAEMTPDSNPTENEIINETNYDELYESFSKDFLDCAEKPGLVVIKAECYENWNNGSVFIPRYSLSFNNTDYYINKRNSVAICPNFYGKPGTKKFDNWLGLATITGVGISMVCIVLHMLMFIILQKLKNLPGYCLFSLCCALMVAYISFIVGSTGYYEHVNCTAAGMISYFSFLASFFWMNAMSFDVWRSLRLATAKLRLTGDRPMLVRFGFYSLYSWGTPLLILIIALIITSVASNDNKYKLEFNADTCWFQYKQGLGVYFAFPIFSLIIVNVVLYVHSSFMISSATMKTSENSVFLWSRFFVSLRLAVVMGLTWIFGAIATATQLQVFSYFFSLCIALQGVFIFFSFTLTEKTKKACMMAIKGKKMSSVTPTVSQQITSI